MIGEKVPILTRPRTTGYAPDAHQGHPLRGVSQSSRRGSPHRLPRLALVGTPPGVVLPTTLTVRAAECRVGESHGVRLRPAGAGVVRH